MTRPHQPALKDELNFTPAKSLTLDGGQAFSCRPAWAHSYGCKSCRELVTMSEVKRNCMRATKCGEEAWIEAAGR
jgi:hypothetical protein